MFSSGRNKQRGSVLIYIFVAIGLLSLLTLSLTDQDSANNARIRKLTEELYNDMNLAIAAIKECTQRYPEAKDLNGDGTIDETDNLNAPWPLVATDANNPNGAAANYYLHLVQCPGAPASDAYIFDTENSPFLTIPNEIINWHLNNQKVSGEYYVSITFYVANNPTMIEVLNRLEARYAQNCMVGVVPGPTYYAFIYYLKATPC